ncbi:hypothetical protein M885DRAFT_622836 [Pelagophyceae sp. CCMP2097]|nr:hypothetical protein M885DRAFT_622836 [Pelagophyceae sp. CCMP2097]
MRESLSRPSLGPPVDSVQRAQLKLAMSGPYLNGREMSTDQIGFYREKINREDACLDVSRPRPTRKGIHYPEGVNDWSTSSSLDQAAGIRGAVFLEKPRRKQTWKPIKEPPQPTPEPLAIDLWRTSEGAVLAAPVAGRSYLWFSGAPSRTDARQERIAPPTREETRLQLESELETLEREIQTLAATKAAVRGLPAATFNARTAAAQSRSQRARLRDADRPHEQFLHTFRPPAYDHERLLPGERHGKIFHN